MGRYGVPVRLVAKGTTYAMGAFAVVAVIASIAVPIAAGVWYVALIWLGVPFARLISWAAHYGDDRPAER